MTRGNAHQYLKKVYLTTKNDSYREALSIALTALRPVSREQVEKVWRGEWRLNEEESKKHVEPIYVCTRCENFEAWGNTEKTNFCGYCGAPMTDETVQMVMEKINNMEEMTNEH